MVESLVWTPPATAGQPAPERGTTCSGNLPLYMCSLPQILSHYCICSSTLLIYKCSDTLPP